MCRGKGHLIRRSVMNAIPLLSQPVSPVFGGPAPRRRSCPTIRLRIRVNSAEMEKAPAFVSPSLWGWKSLRRRWRRPFMLLAETNSLMQEASIHFLHTNDAGWTPVSHSPLSAVRDKHSVSLSGPLIQSGRRMRSELWPLPISPNAHALRHPAYLEEMTSSSAAVSPGSRLAGTRPIAAEITPPNDYYTLWGIASTRVTTDTPPSAGRIDGAAHYW